MGFFWGGGGGGGVGGGGGRGGAGFVRGWVGGVAVGGADKMTKGCILRRN